MLFSDLKGTYETTTETTDHEPGTTDYLITLVKNVENKQKVLKVVLKGVEYTVIEITPRTDGQLKGSVSVNGQDVPVSTQNVYQYKIGEHATVLQVYGLPTGEVKVISPLYKFAILYYGETARITVNQDYMNNVRGLCGTNNGDNFDFITPQEYVLQNPEEFAATWALSAEGRNGEMKNRAQQHSMYKKSVNLTPVVSEADISRATGHGLFLHSHHTTTGSHEHSEVNTNIRGYKELKENSSPGCTTTRINVIEKDGQHCFSIEPQPTCTTQCHAETSTTATGEYFCVEKSSTSLHWQQMVSRGANPDFRNKGKTQTMEFQRPTKCA